MYTCDILQLQYDLQRLSAVAHSSNSSITIVLISGVIAKLLTPAPQSGLSADYSAFLIAGLMHICTPLLKCIQDWSQGFARAVMQQNFVP